jgi:hypothetical protein
MQPQVQAHPQVVDPEMRHAGVREQAPAQRGQDQQD